MKIPAERIQKLLGKDVYAAIKSLGAIAEKSGQPCYLVGGFVRDIILNVPSLDIDLVSDGKITWIPEIVKVRSIKKITRSQFSTVKIHFTRGFAFDIARARKETYPKPAALPKVEPGTLEEDAARRDFTINTLLMDISSSRFGNVLDLCSGVQDLKQGTIRVLHEKSFRDDPTRILRALRFKYRFSFRFDRKTAMLLNQAIRRSYIKKLSPQRIRREFFLILAEETWDDVVKELRRSGVLSQLGLPSDTRNRAVDRLRSAQDERAMVVQSPELSKLIALSATASRAEVKRFSTRIGLRKNESKLLLSVLEKRKTILRKLSRSGISNSDIFVLLEGIPDEGLLFLFSMGSKRARKHIQHYRRKLRATRLLITGNDLKSIGIKEGPQFSRILRKILMLKLDGKTRSRRDEISVARSSLNEGS